MAIRHARVSAIAAEPGDELAVDDLVTVDRLGDQPWQRALGALAVDRVEPEGDAEQRTEDAEELVERRHPFGRQREQVEEDRRRLRGRVGGVADRPARRVHRRQSGERHEHEQDQEAHRRDVVGELLAGDDPPPAAEAGRGARRPLRRRARRQLAPSSPSFRFSSEVAVVDRVEVGVVAASSG